MAGLPRVLARNPGITSVLRRKSIKICREMPGDFGVNVYRKSTGDLVLGKSSGKKCWT
jgi:hypothetical protein